MIPFLVSLLGLTVISVCIFLFWQTGKTWFNRMFGEALVQDIRDIREAKAAQSTESEDSKE
jgi:hypothetical protein